jgi:predicted RNase H-like nuclease (RuvC/YqgF family)
MDTIHFIIGAIGTSLAGLVAYLRSKKGRAKAISYLRRLFNIDLTTEDLRLGLDNISAVVDAQGNSIAYLTQQLDSYREQLTDAREQLKEMENLHKENSQLKKRVVELESQVARLETELERRKKYTPKKYKEEE